MVTQFPTCTQFRGTYDPVPIRSGTTCPILEQWRKRDCQWCPIYVHDAYGRQVSMNSASLSWLRVRDVLRKRTSASHGRLPSETWRDQLAAHFCKMMQANADETRTNTRTDEHDAQEHSPKFQERLEQQDAGHGVKMADKSGCLKRASDIADDDLETRECSHADPDTSVHLEQLENAAASRVRIRRHRLRVHQYEVRRVRVVIIFFRADDADGSQSDSCDRRVRQRTRFQHELH